MLENKNKRERWKLRIDFSKEEEAEPHPCEPGKGHPALVITIPFGVSLRSVGLPGD